MKTPTVPVTFNVAELWLMVSVIKHELAEAERWKFPPTNRELVEEIMLALLACEDYKLDEYTLEMSEGDCLLVQYNIQPDMKTPEGAVGKFILLKVFRALSKLSYDYDVGGSDTIVSREVIEDAVTNEGPNNDAEDDDAGRCAAARS